MAAAAGTLTVSSIEQLSPAARLPPVSSTVLLPDTLEPLPRIEIDPDTFTVTVDGEVMEEAPAEELPMAQRYFLF